MVTPGSTLAPAPRPADPKAHEPLPAPQRTAPARHPSLLLMPLCIGGILSGVITRLNLGVVDGFWWRWFTGFASALPVIALGLTLVGAYERLVRQRMPHATAVLRQLLMAALMALPLELLMSSVSTLRDVGWAEGFAAAWVSAFVHSLPVGLAIALLMGFVLRPRLQRQRNRAAAL